MFYQAINFNQDIGSWNMGSVTRFVSLICLFTSTAAAAAALISSFFHHIIDTASLYRKTSLKQYSFHSTLVSLRGMTDTNVYRCIEFQSGS